MTTQKSPALPAKKTDPSHAPPGQHLLPSAAGIRETIESVVIAFILAFLFRTFEAEAFVIPTGSMAPTLMGRHKDLVCPKCGSPYQISSSEEVADNPNVIPRRVDSGTCPMCRYPADLSPSNPQRTAYPSFSGDRILVSKFAYEIGEPQRWDVLVFHYPADAQTNFIKRLIGLPGETIRIQNGDIWTRNGKQDARGAFQIARKPPGKLLAMLQPVFDNDYMPRIASYGWPTRWQPAASNHGRAAWKSDDMTSFLSDAEQQGLNWLRYRHLVPSGEQWQNVENGGPAPDVEPSLVTDFTAYDTGGSREGNHPETGQFWVGDLGLETTVDVLQPGGKIAFELREGGRRFLCVIDLSTGRAELQISGPDMEPWRPTATTKLQGVGKHRVRFTNCDNQLLLWIDDRLVSFDQPTTYQNLGNSQPDASDFSPAGIASQGAKVRVSNLRLLRDIYYLAIAGNDGPQFRGDVTPPGYVEFGLGPDQFFVLGDNSAKSKDSRLWGTDYWVSRELLIGKALFIYWPHSWDKIRTPWFDIPLPFYPNFSRMGLVR